jgi:hypothetical protein
MHEMDVSEKSIFRHLSGVHAVIEVIRDLICVEDNWRHNFPVAQHLCIPVMWINFCMDRSKPTSCRIIFPVE